MIYINSKKIEDAVYNLCITANTQYNAKLYDLMYEKYKNSYYSIKYANILKNIETASKLNRPLCQDTGQVIVFVKIGKNISVIGEHIDNAINTGIEKAYIENSFRLSVVKNALFDRKNTNTNTPATIYTEFTDDNEIQIDLMIKGAGSENYCDIKMFSPNTSKEEIFNFIKTAIQNAGEKSCPPFVLGIGAGGTFDKAAVLSKKAFFKNQHNDEENKFISDLKIYLKDINENILDMKLETFATHIACLPIAITINCHSTRHATCVINENETNYINQKLKLQKILTKTEEISKINTDETEKIKALKVGEEILLSGEIYTARDAAHKRLEEEYNKTGKLPIDLQNKIIFYAGPCPANKNEIIGPIGPTTSTRMDNFSELIYSNGVIATIGKGERNQTAEEVIKKYNGKYLTIQGGISCLIAKCITQAEIIAFNDLGTEAIRKLMIKDLPVKVEI